MEGCPGIAAPRVRLLVDDDVEEVVLDAAVHLPIDYM